MFWRSLRIKRNVKECECQRNEDERNKITKHKLEEIREIGQKERDFYNIPDTHLFRSCVRFVAPSPLPFFASSVIKDKSELNKRSSASVLFSSRSRHSSKPPNLFPLWISEYSASLVFICGSGTHPFGSTRPQQSRINLSAVTSGTGQTSKSLQTC